MGAGSTESLNADGGDNCSVAAATAGEGGVEGRSSCTITWLASVKSSQQTAMKQDGTESTTLCLVPQEILTSTINCGTCLASIFVR